MARQSMRLPEQSEVTEMGCMWRLFGVFESGQRHGSRKLISNGISPARNKNVSDYPKSRDTLTSFDAECLNIRNGAGSATARNLIQENVADEEYKKKTVMSKKQKHKRKDSEVDISARDQAGCKPSADPLENVADVVYEKLLRSTRNCSNELSTGPMLEAICNQIHRENDGAFQDANRSINNGQFDMQIIQMGAKAFMNQMFIDEKFISKEGPNSEPKPFSDALEILSTNKNLVMELLQDPCFSLGKDIRNLQESWLQKETVKFPQDAVFPESRRRVARDSQKPDCSMEIQKRDFNSLFSEYIKYRHGSSSKGSHTPQPSNKIVVLKPIPKNIRSLEGVGCYCSSLRPQHSLNSKVHNVKNGYFSLRKVRRKLKFSFGRSEKETRRAFTDGTLLKISHKKQISKVGYRDGRQDLNTKIPAYSFMSANSMEKLWQKEQLEQSSVSLTKKKEFDIVLEAKKHLSARLKNSKAIENPASQKSLRTLGRILSSPERDVLPLSPRMDKEYLSVSAQMRFGPCSNSHMGSESSWSIKSGRPMICSSPTRQNEEHESYNESSESCDKLEDLSSKSSIIRIHQKMHADISLATDDLQSNGQEKIVEMDSNLHRTSVYRILEVPRKSNGSDVSETMLKPNRSEFQEKDGNLMYSKPGTTSEAQAFRNALEDSTSSPLRTYQVDISDSIKDREEHPSPISVLEPFYTEDEASPSNMALQTGRHSIQPLRINFDVCSYESPSQTLDSPNNQHACMDEENSVLIYIQSVLQASYLNWDDLSAVSPVHDQLLDPSLYNKMDLLPFQHDLDPKLIFDHINEVLLEIHRRHFSSTCSLSSPQPKIRAIPLEEHVIAEVIKGMSVHLSPPMARRTLGQIVEEDVAGRSWLDIQVDIEAIAIQISEDILEESIYNTVFSCHE